MSASRKPTQEIVDDFETRARNAPEVYRFFNDPRGFAIYLDGAWAGEGLQALPEWPPETAMSVWLSCDPETAGLSLRLRSHARGAGVGAGRIFAGLLRWFRNGRAPGAPGFQTALEFQLDLKKTDAGVVSEESSFGPDYARLREGDWELTVQVLENIRAHVQLRRLGGTAPIYFSGVLKKQR